VQCVNNALWQGESAWVKKVPYDIRDEAMNDVLKAYKTSIAAKRRKFTVAFKSRKATSDSIAILAKHWKSAGIFHPTFWGKIPLRSSEPLPAALAYDCRLQHVRGEYYLCIPQPLEMRSENQAPDFSAEGSVISLDPGVRTFLSGYNPDGSLTSFGDKDIGKIMSLCRHLDKLQSKCSRPDVRHKQRYQMRRAAGRMRKRIQDLIRDAHHKIAKYLCQNYRVILLPSFESRHMVSRIKRRIGSKTARMMLTWSHYSFRQRLLDKAREYPWCKVFIVDEAYTSKTCTRCGSLHMKLGASKTFDCPCCSYTIDRDANGARNSLLKFLTEDPRAGATRCWGLAPGGAQASLARLDWNVLFRQESPAFN
jgi:putative transposase